ncbi:chemotaxis protein CheW [Chitinivorax sp. B]|uniref:chemotaxis protein CheW n=1 Tax=Chitinivorax sp. B TaxID=2502235 RepID=UPI0010F45B8C|nr:chemotaxis protein CheW [Chitinivorax sp. B]
MTTTLQGLFDTLTTLRDDFNHAFSQPPAHNQQNARNLLAINVAGDTYALHVNDIGGVHVDRQIVPLPSPLPALLGLAGFRGQIVPVYDLAILLGYTPQPAARWLVQVRSTEAVALAFHRFDGHFSVTNDDIVPLPDDIAVARRHVAGGIRDTTGIRAVITLASVLQDIRQRATQFHQLETAT